MKEKTNRKKDILFLLAIFVLVNIFVQGPDLIRAINKPPDKWYTGHASWFDPWDINLYTSTIGWGKRNGILLENLYDTQPYPGVPILPFYTSLGKISSAFNLSSPLIFHLAGVVVSLLLVGVVFWFIKIFLKNELEQKIALLLLFFGGGFGWLFLVFADTFCSAFTLTNALRRPHEGVSLILFLIALGSLWLGGTKQKNHFLFWGILSSFLMLFFHPYKLLHLAVCFFGFGLYWWWKKKSLIFFKILFVLTLEGIIYYLAIARIVLANPSFSGLTRQQYSSPVPSVIGGWGPLFVFIAIAYLIKKPSKEIIFLKIWFLSHWLLIYFPSYFQRDLTKGLWIPAMVLAVKGIKRAFPKKQAYQVAVMVLLVFASLSTLFMFVARIMIIPQDRWVYLTEKEGEIIDYLAHHGNNEEGVLASYPIANLIPAHTTKRVWVGHGFQSPNFEERIAGSERFFAGEMEEEEAKSFLEKTRVVWVFWGPGEKEIAGLSEIPYQYLLEPVIENPTASLYQVK